MSEPEVVLGVRRRSREEALSLVTAYQASGQSRRKFCAQHGLAVPTPDSHGRGRHGSTVHICVMFEYQPLLADMWKRNIARFQCRYRLSFVHRPRLATSQSAVASLR